MPKNDKPTYKYVVTATIDGKKTGTHCVDAVDANKYARALLEKMLMRANTDKEVMTSITIENYYVGN